MKPPAYSYPTQQFGSTIRCAHCAVSVGEIREVSDHKPSCYFRRRVEIDMQSQVIPKTLKETFPPQNLSVLGTPTLSHSKLGLELPDPKKVPTTLEQIDSLIGQMNTTYDELARIDRYEGGHQSYAMNKVSIQLQALKRIKESLKV